MTQDQRDPWAISPCIFAHIPFLIKFLFRGEGCFWVWWWLQALVMYLLLLGRPDWLQKYRSSPPEVLLEKGVLKICSKLTREHPCQSVISIKLQSNFIEITLRHGCSPVNLLHFFRTPFSKNSSGRVLLEMVLVESTIGYAI